MHGTRRTWALRCAFLWMLLVASVGAVAQPAPVEAVSGGIGQAERESLQLAQGRYSFFMRTAISRSGAYLSGVQVTITNNQDKRVVLEHTMQGPWLLAALPPGPYTVQVSHLPTAGAPPQVQRQSTTIKAGVQRQMVFYFAGDDTVGDGETQPATAPRKPAKLSP